MRGISEVHGIDLIKRLALERIERPGMKDRVWSDEFNSWGFFADSPNESDVFLIMGCSMPGDMFVTNNKSPQLFDIYTHGLIEKNPDGPFVITGLKCFELLGTQVVGLEMLSSNPPIMCQILSQQSSLFKIAWSSL